MCPHSHRVGWGLAEEQWRAARRVTIRRRGTVLSRLEVKRMEISDLRS